MNKRKLNPDELKLCTKSMIQLEYEIAYNEYQVESCERMINKGLELDFKKKQRDTKQLKREFESELKISKEKRNLLKDQIRNGVEMKEEVKGGKDGK